MPVSQDDPQQTVQIFIDLIQRHEQSFYYFVHKVHSKGEGLFSGLMRWIELFLDIVREGLGEPISLEFILPHTGDERRDVMKEPDEVALHHYKLKIAHESKLRRRFGRADADIGGDDENSQEIVGGLVRDVSLGDFMRGGILDMAAEQEEEESSDDSEESSSDYESAGETGSEESSESSSLPPAQLQTSPSTPSLSKATPQHAQEVSFPPSQPSKLAVPPPAESPSPSPLRPARAPSAVASTSSTGTRLRKLSMTLRKSRSMTFNSSRPSPSNNAEAPPPPVPSLPQSVAQSRSAAPLSASRSKQLPTLPQSSSASPSRQPVPNAHTRSPEKKRYPHPQNLPQVPKKQSKPAAGAPRPPELKKIAELLPIFVEMVCRNFSAVVGGCADVSLLLVSQMRPSLRPRERSEGQSGSNSNPRLMGN